MQKFFPTVHQEQSGGLQQSVGLFVELLAGFLLTAVVALVLIKLTAQYGLIPTDALDYSDIFLAP
jgi:hypothetical protein